MKQAFFVVGTQRGIIEENKMPWAHIHVLGDDQGRDQADRIGFMPSQQTCDPKVIDEIRNIPLPAWVDLEIELRPMKKGVRAVITHALGEVKRPTLTPELAPVQAVKKAA